MASLLQALKARNRQPLPDADAENIVGRVPTAAEEAEAQSGRFPGGAKRKKREKVRTVMESS